MELLIAIWLFLGGLGYPFDFPGWFFLFIGAIGLGCSALGIFICQGAYCGSDERLLVKGICLFLFGVIFCFLCIFGFAATLNSTVAGSVTGCGAHIQLSFLGNCA